MLNKIILFSFAFTILLIGCSPVKRTIVFGEDPLKPSWTSQKPINPSYYYGVGKAEKRIHSSNSQQVAKNQALQDLASEIEVKINSSSVLSQKETNRNFYETFQSTIRVEATKSLSGFEPIESWSSDSEYWVLYRLSKIKYKEVEEKKRKQAINQGLYYLDKSEKSPDYKTSFDNLVEALTSIKSYLNEPLSTTLNEKPVFLGNYIVSRIEEKLDGLELISAKTSLVFNFKNCYRDTSNWLLTFDGEPVSKMPVRIKFITYSAQEITSDQNGVLSYPILIKYQENTQRKIEAWIALSDWIDTPLLLSLFEDKYAFQTQNTNSLSPAFFVNTEKGMGQIQKQIIKSGGRIVVNKDDADLIINFKFDTNDLGKANDFYTAKCEINAMITDKNEALLFHLSFPPAKGVQLNRDGARDKSIENAIKQINYHWFQNLISDICEY